MNERLWKYLRHDKKKVNGWLQRVDSEIVGSILEFQYEHNISGSCVEIGVHHGKSFIPLCMALRDDESALCIDVFDNQSKNLDSSGEGDLNSFQKNLARYHLNSSRIHIFKGSSEDIGYEDIIRLVGPVRFFSVDGGHWKSIVKNDLYLAEKSLSKDGVIALDDYCRTEWPDVTTGYTLWQEETESDIVPFAAGSNKLFLCRKELAATYRGVLKSPFLSNFFNKSYKSDKGQIDSYRVEFIEQDETQLKGMVLLVCKMFFPDTFAAFKTKIKALTGRIFQNSIVVR